jgi:Domain of unknown function (DUF4190)
MSADQPPSPFSREGSSPDDQQGGTSNTGPNAPESRSTSDSGAPQSGDRSWPTYPSRPEPTAPVGDDPYGPPSRPPTVGYDQQQASPYGGVADSPYGTPPYPSTPAYGPEQPYGNNYGDSPYEMNRYQPQFGSATPYQSDYGSSASYGAPAVQHPQAVIALVLGILGLAVCPLIGIAALVVGNKARKDIDASPAQFAGRGMATAGYVLGIISVVLTVLVVLIIVLGIGGALSS